MAEHKSRTLWIVDGIVVAMVAAIFFRLQIAGDSKEVTKKKGDRPVPVEVAEVQRGPLSFSRTFSGTIDLKHSSLLLRR